MTNVAPVSSVFSETFAYNGFHGDWIADVPPLRGARAQLDGAAVRLTMPDRGEGEIALHRRMPLPAILGRRVKLKARVKLEAPPGAYARVLIAARASNTHRHYSDVASTSQISAAKWTDAQAVIDVPTVTEGADLRLELHGAGTAWFDDIEVSVVGPTPAPEGTRLSDFQISSLVSLTRAATQIRYFHPSDQAASLDWNAFLPSAAARILQVRDRRELRAVLAEIFHPIAPTADFVQSGQTLATPELAAPSPGLYLTRWSRFAHDAGFRVGRDSEGQQLAQQSTMLPLATPGQCAGAELRADAQVLDGQGQVDLYVEQLLPAERKSLKMIALGPGSHEYRIPFDIAAEAQGISARLRLTGSGGVILRSLALTCAHGPTVVVPLATSRWTASGAVDLYSWDIAPCGANTCATLKSKPLDIQFVAARDLVTVDLGSGLQLHMPTAVWTDGRRTLPESIAPVARGDFAAGDLAVRLSAVMAIWGTLGTFYPYFHDQQVDWLSVLPGALQEAATTSAPDDFHAVLSRLVAHLPDSHGRVTHPHAPFNGILPVAFRRFGSRLLVYSALREYAAQMPVGSEVLSIQGHDAIQELQRVSSLVAAATEHAKRFSSEFRLRLGELGTFARLRIRTVDGKESDVVLPYISRELYNLGVPYERPKSGTEVAKGVIYLDFDSLTEEQWSALLPTLRGARSLIWDFRGYTGNIAFTAVAHLLEREILEPMFLLPKHAPLGSRSFFENQTPLRPAGPHLTATIVALIDGQSASAVETILQMLREHKLALLVGETSAGTNGNTDIFQVPGGFEVRFTTWRVSNPDGTTLHGHGIAPDQIVHPTEEGLRAGRDEVLSAAIAAAQQLSPRASAGTRSVSARGADGPTP